MTTSPVRHTPMSTVVDCLDHGVELVDGNGDDLGRLHPVRQPGRVVEGVLVAQADRRVLLALMAGQAAFLGHFPHGQDEIVHAVHGSHAFPDKVLAAGRVHGVELPDEVRLHRIGPILRIERFDRGGTEGNVVLVGRGDGVEHLVGGERRRLQLHDEAVLADELRGLRPHDPAEVGAHGLHAVQHDVGFLLIFLDNHLFKITFDDEHHHGEGDQANTPADKQEHLL